MSPLPLDFPATNFGLLDWAIVVVYLSISLAIGFKVRKYMHNMTRFIGAGRAVGTWLGVATMTGTEMGLITIMYSAQKGFTGGFAAFHIGVIAIVVTFFVGLSGFIVYRLRELRVLTIPEYYEQRFGKRARILGGVLLAFGGILNMGLFLKVGAMFIVAITGIPAQGPVIAIVMTILLILVLIYTTLGGMVSVIITDYIQFVVLSIGLLGVSIFALHEIGLDALFQTVASEMGDAGLNPFSTEGTFGIAYVCWMALTAGLVSCAIWPTAVARALAAKSSENNICFPP
ncbi:MAG: SSS family solute:Na+ symporter [Candidatus Marinamargulisbacteria bacterium]|jgi:SSS family solute:Na+ symporter